VVVVIDSGQDAGTHTATGDPSCAYGVIDAGTWSAQFGSLVAGQTDLSTVQLTDSPDSSKPDARIVSVYLTIGPLFGGRSYTLSLDRFSDTPYTRDVQDNGSTAVIHVAGETIESPLGPGGIGVDVTLNCPTVSR